MKVTESVLKVTEVFSLNWIRFEYVHEAPFGLYGSIPFMISHGKSHGTSGFSGWIRWRCRSMCWRPVGTQILGSHYHRIGLESTHCGWARLGLLTLSSSLVQSLKTWSNSTLVWLEHLRCLNSFFFSFFLDFFFNFDLKKKEKKERKSKTASF